MSDNLGQKVYVLLANLNNFAFRFVAFDIVRFGNSGRVRLQGLGAKVRVAELMGVKLEADWDFFGARFRIILSRPT